MNALLDVATILSAVLFLWYGSRSLLTDAMRTDFERFGLSRFRRMTGGLEVFGALGLLIGLGVPMLLTVSAAGLSLLMLFGIIARLRVRDPWTSTAPAFALMLLNLLVAVYA